MSEKLLAGLVAAVAIAPLCAVCVLGPAVIASIFTGIAAWLGGFDVIVASGLVLGAGVAVFAVFRKRRAQPASAEPAGETNQ